MSGHMTTSPNAVRAAARVVLGCLVASAAVAGRVDAQTKALTLAEVIDLRQQGVSTRQILRNARAYCISFAVNDSVKQELASAGRADTLLVGGLRDVCSTVRAPIRPSATAIVDDELAHTSASQAFAWGDRRCKARFESAGVRVENRSNDAVCMMRYPSPELNANVRIELTVSQLGTVPFGTVLLGFGRSGNSPNQYALSVGADRRVELCWSADRVCSPLVRRTGVEAVLPAASDENRIGVEIRGQEITLLVNGNRVTTYSADANVTGRISLGIGPGTSLLFVRLRAEPLQ